MNYIQMDGNQVETVIINWGVKKMKYKILLIYLFLMTLNNVVAMSRIIEAFTINNYSSKDVIISVEFWEEETAKNQNYGWTQTINDRMLSISFRLFNSQGEKITQEYRLLPKRGGDIIEYYPLGSLFSVLDEIPFMDKIKSIFKKLEIVCDDGKRIITIDNLGERIIKKNAIGGGNFYYLEIFDYDLEGKLASEW